MQPSSSRQGINTAVPLVYPYSFPGQNNVCALVQANPNPSVARANAYTGQKGDNADAKHRYLRRRIGKTASHSITIAVDDPTISRLCQNKTTMPSIHFGITRPKTKTPCIMQGHSISTNIYIYARYTRYIYQPVSGRSVFLSRSTTPEGATCPSPLGQPS